LSLEWGVSGIKADDLELIQVISQFPNINAKIGSSMLRILRFFVTKPYLSTYQIQKALREKGEDTAYEKVRQKIKRLHSFKLIEEIRKEDVCKLGELVHRAVYYKLSAGGIFYLLYKAKHIVPFLRPLSRRSFIRHHGDNIIFRTFLYPYLEKQTLLDIKGLVITEEIFRYLYRCCDTIHKTIDSLEKFKDTSQWTKPLFDWNNIPGQHDRGTLMFLDNEFHLNMGEYIRLEKTDQGQTLRILHEKNDVTLIKLDKEKEDRAFLICSDKRQYELGVERSANTLMICIPTGTPKECLLERFAEEIEHKVMSFVFSLVIRLTDLTTFIESFMEICRL
jgi:hypothetical protein